MASSDDIRAFFEWAPESGQAKVQPEVEELPVYEEPAFPKLQYLTPDEVEKLVMSAGKHLEIRLLEAYLMLVSNKSASDPKILKQLRSDFDRCSRGLANFRSTVTPPEDVSAH